MSNRDHLSFLDKYSIEHKVSGSDETLLRDKQTGTYILMKQVSVESAEQFKVVIDTLQSQRCLRHQHLLSLIDYEIRPEQSKSGVNRKVITFFEYSCHNLQDQIEARLRENRPFEQSQLWSLLCSPTLGLSYLQKQSIGHGCVSPIDIFLTLDGSIKIADPSIATSSPLDCVEGYYYSPEMLHGDNDVDVFKSDVWSLGMCAVHAGLLQACDDCYDYQNGNFSFETLQDKLQRLGESYSQEFIEVLVMMLNVEVEQRPNFIELQQHLISLLNPNNQDLSCSQQSLQQSSSRLPKMINSKSRTTRQSQLQLPQGLRGFKEQTPEQESEQDAMCNCIDLESEPDMSEEREEKVEAPEGMTDREMETQRERETQIMHIESQRVIETMPTEVSEQPVMITTSSVRRPYFQQPMTTTNSNTHTHTHTYSNTNTYRQTTEQSRFQPNRFQPTRLQPSRLTQSRIPMCITTSKYQQQNIRDYFNLGHLPNNTSVIIEQKPKNSTFHIPYYNPNNNTVAPSTTTYTAASYFDKKPTPTPYETTVTTTTTYHKPAAYNEWGGYVYRPTEEQLFTDPKLLFMMKSDLERIQTRQQHKGTFQ